MLVSSQTAVKGGHVFEIAVRMENLRSGNWDEIQNKGHRVRMHSRSSLFSVVFMFFDVPNTEIYTWIEYNKYQGMRKKSRFDEILELLILILYYFVSLAFCVRVS